MSAVRRVRWSAAVVVLTLAAALTPEAVLGAPRVHHPAPTAAQLAQGRHEVAQREHEVKVAAASVGRARARLAGLNVSAEVAFEAYDGAEVKLKAAQRAVQTAHRVLATANTQVVRGQARVTRFAISAYESGSLSKVTAYLEPGGPAQLISRFGAIDAISRTEQTTLQRLAAAKLYQAVVSRQAEAVEATASAAAVVAGRAKAAAAADVARQSAVLAGLRKQQGRLQTLLAQAKTHATRLQRAHLAALARARARAAARAAAPPPPAAPSPYTNVRDSTAGTVSTATAAAALQAAESQIGKPYQWGAAGPNTYDCSGLMLWAYAQVGVSLDHWTGDQWNEGAHVSRSELRPGDLVFFAYNPSDPSTIHHVGMYVGNGQMVDAPYTGADVEYDSVLRPDYIGAVRPYQR